MTKKHSKFKALVKLISAASCLGLSLDSAASVAYNIYTNHVPTPNVLLAEHTDDVVPIPYGSALQYLSSTSIKANLGVWLKAIDPNGHTTLVHVSPSSDQLTLMDFNAAAADLLRADNYPDNNLAVGLTTQVTNDVTSLDTDMGLLASYQDISNSSTPFALGGSIYNLMGLQTDTASFSSSTIWGRYNFLVNTAAQYYSLGNTNFATIIDSISAISNNMAIVKIGSVYDHSNTGGTVTLTIDDGQKVILDGTNYWAAAPTNYSSMDNKVSGLLPNAVYLSDYTNGTNSITGLLLTTDNTGAYTGIPGYSYTVTSGPYNYYPALTDVDFQNGSSELNIDAANGEPIYLKTAFSNADNATVTTNSSGFIAANPSFMGVNTVNIGNTDADPNNPSTLPSLSVKLQPDGAWFISTYMTGNYSQSFDQNGYDISHLNLYGNAELILDSSAASDQVHFTTPSQIIGGFSVSRNLVDLQGRILINAQNNNLTVDPNGSYCAFGCSQYNRLQSFTMQGDRQADMMVRFFAKDLILDSSGIVNLIHTRNNLGTDSTLTLKQDVIIGSSIVLAADNPVVTLGTYSYGQANAYTLNASVGSVTMAQGQPISLITSNMSFTGDVVINTAFNTSQNRGGKIVVDSAGITQSPSTLDLSGANSVTITLTPDSGVEGGSFTVFHAQNKGVVNVPQQLVTAFVDPTYTNKLVPVNWTYSPETYTFNGTPEMDTALPAIISFGASEATVNLAQHLLTPGPSGALIPAQTHALTNLGSTNTFSEAVERLAALPAAVNGAIAAEEAGDIAMRNIATRLSSHGTKTTVAQEEELGAAAGNLEGSSSVWISGSTQVATQKSFGNTVGYKIRNYGGTFGADTPIGENFVLGAAWTRVNSVIKHRDALNGNKSDIITNLFSLYGIISLADDWRLEPTLSGGFGRAKSKMVRYSTVGPTYASANYKAKSYVGALHLSKGYAFHGNLIFEPRLGINYTKIDDDSYTETGGAINFLVRKRVSYNLEGLIGGKLIGSYSYGGYLLKPEISAAAHITIKDKQGKIHTSVDATLNPAEIPTDKASAAWYSFGAGVMAHQDNYEFGLGYTLELDKKYVGHQGSVRLKVHF